MAKADEPSSFFERERDRLSGEIAAGFEELLVGSNVLNRKLEGVIGMTREFETITTLWSNFHHLMRREDGVMPSTDEHGLQGPAHFMETAPRSRTGK